MKTAVMQWAAAFLVLLNLPASAALHYVSVDSTNPVAPYLTWENAASTIQDAVEVAHAGDEIIVTNGVYASGGRAMVGTMTNRVAIYMAVTVRSVNGPSVTLIVGQGAGTQGTNNGVNVIRCVYVGYDAVLSGFTLTNGHTRMMGDYRKEQSGGGAWCEASGLVTNCTMLGNSAYSYGGGAYGGTLNNCTLRNNLAASGGGAASNTLNNCLLIRNSVDHYGGGAMSCVLFNCGVSSNSATYGGGAYSSSLTGCTLAGNSAEYGGGTGGRDSTLINCSLIDNRVSIGGGGADLGTLTNCRFTNNSAHYGGGATYATLNKCTLIGNKANVGVNAFGGGTAYGTVDDCTFSGNWANGFGGGTAYSGVNNCTFAGNSASEYGGGAAYGTLTNCTLSGNSAGQSGGGAAHGTLRNSIIYYNTAPSRSNHYGCTMDYCCTTPLQTGIGNITNAPLFINTNGWSDLRLQSNSPCINAGNNIYAVGGTDLDGNPRIAGGRVDMGAYEFQGAGLSGFTAWLWQYGLLTDGSAQFIDSDGDRLNNYQEWRCGTDPTNGASVLRLLGTERSGLELVVRWQSVSNVSYFLERSTNLSVTAGFEQVATNLLGAAGVTGFRDTNAAAGQVYFRVGVGN